MTLDISNLSPEKRAFLKAHPELLKSLEKQIPKQMQEVETRRKKFMKGESKLRRDLEDIYRKSMVDPHLRRIQSQLMRKLHVETETKELVCPVCGDRDHGNEMNGKHWCFKCNSPLIPKEQLKRWQKMAKIRAVGSSLKDEFKRRGLDF